MSALRLPDYFNRSPAYQQYAQRRQRREDTARARVLYAAPELVQCSFPSPLCQLVAEFAGSVCANARPSDGQPHTRPTEWVLCSLCHATLCSIRCGRTDDRACPHALCLTCIRTRGTFCNSCHTTLAGCEECRRPRLCRSKLHLLYYCRRCGASAGDMCLGCLRHLPADPKIETHKRKHA